MKKQGFPLLSVPMCVPASEILIGVKKYMFSVGSFLYSSLINNYKHIQLRYSHWSLRGPFRIPLIPPYTRGFIKIFHLFSISRTLPETQFPSQIPSIPVNILKTCLSFISLNFYNTGVQ